MPKFSIVIPCWNAEVTIAQTLWSVRNQTFADWEAIIFDDGSTDWTSSILEDVCAGDPRFKVIKGDRCGPSAARNKAVFDHTIGDYVAFLDADDIWALDKLERCAARLSRPGAPDVLYAGISFFKDEPNDAKTRSTVPPGPLTIGQLLRENPTCTMSNVVVERTKFLLSGGFESSIAHGEDVEWMIRMITLGCRIEGINNTLVFYRASDVGLSADLGAMYEGWRKAVTTARRLETSISDRDLAAAEAVYCRYLARRALRIRSRRFTALGFALRGIFSSPRDFFDNPRRGWLTLVGAFVEPMLTSRMRQAAFTS